ncbi:hypothetical protein DSO57_1010045 [Entomophthora muscae]|uniref:Uncharacterized protein n=1 Tax=Entomophthora muscae TaxID=34485 RepID=A0ACC2RXS0_9FUNG|nr:hypothetical protein DSO57_1010045 [Entomophthora muscae]
MKTTIEHPILMKYAKRVLVAEGATGEGIIKLHNGEDIVEVVVYTSHSVYGSYQFTITPVIQRRPEEFNQIAKRNIVRAFGSALRSGSLITIHFIEYLGYLGHWVDRCLYGNKRYLRHLVFPWKGNS